MSQGGLNSFGDHDYTGFLGGCNYLTKQGKKLCYGASNAIPRAFTFLRENNSFFDFACTSTLRALNGIGAFIFRTQIFDEIALQTIRERNWDREVKDLRQELSGRPRVLEFCSVTAQSIYTLILKLGAFGLRKAPEQVEYWAFWRLDWYVRYMYRQFSKQGGKERALNTKIATHLQASYQGLATRMTHSIALPTLQSLANVELLLLKVSQVLLTLSPNHEKSLRLKAALFRRIAKSLDQQRELDKVRKNRRTEGEKAIAVFDWLKKEGDLPAGLPDPDDSLFPENLPEKEQKALYGFVSKEISKILSRFAPDFFKTGLTGWAYYLEGDQLVHLITLQVISLVFDQIGDPDRFAQAILFSQGEVLDLELDGFGMNKEALILKTGQAVLEAAREGKSNAVVHEIFKKSELRQSPGGEEGNRQKEATRQRLQDYFGSIFLQMIKEEIPIQSDEPIMGAASLGRNLLMKGMGFVIGYLRQLNFFASQKIQEMVANYFARRIVSLIYHPSWKIILLQLIEAASMKIQEESDEIPRFLAEDFDKIGSFFGDLFFGSIEASKIPSFTTLQSVAGVLGWLKVNLTEETLGQVLSNTFLYYKRDELFGMFESLMYARAKNTATLAEKGMELTTPTLKEVMLYCRLIDALRKKSHSIPSDDKFWESYLRICLPILAEQKIIHSVVEEGMKARFPNPSQAAPELWEAMQVSVAEDFASNPKSILELYAAREGVIDDLLALKDDELIVRLKDVGAAPSKESSASQGSKIKEKAQ